jgi:hypothetical protein
LIHPLNDFQHNPVTTIGVVGGGQEEREEKEEMEGKK